MSGSTLNEQGTIVVISDLHVGADWLHQNAKDRIIELIGKITGRVGTGPQLIPHPQCVVFAGDIVDLWVHKRTVEPPTFEKLWREDPFGQLLMNAINDLLNANIHVVYIAGNHDMKATKADIDQLFGADRIEFVAQNNCWMSDGPVNREGRVIVAHGHQCDLFNRPVPSGGRADDLPFGYFVSRLAATTGKTQTLSWIQRLALGYLPNMVWEDVANRMLTAPPVRTLISSAPQRAMKENLWFMLECRLLKEAGKLTLDETNLDDWNRELNEIDFKLPGGLTMTLGEVLHDYESIYVSGQGTGATQMTPTQTVVHWIVDRAIGLMRNTSPTPQVSVSTALMSGATEALGSYADLLHQKSRVNKVVVMGHTHTTDYQERSGYHYVNSGGWVPTTDSETRTTEYTFVEILQNSSVRTHSWSSQKGWTITLH